MSITEVRRPIEDLDLPQINHEIRTRWEQAEALINGGKCSEEDLERGKALLAEVDQFEAVRAKKESKSEMVRRIQEGKSAYTRPAESFEHTPPRDDRASDPRARKSAGQQFIDAAEYKGLLSSGMLNSDQWAPPEFGVKIGGSILEQRAILRGGDAASGGGFVTPDYRPGFVDIRQRQLTILDLITRIPTDSDTISYVREDTFTNSAAFTAEATATTGTSGTKPESALAFSRQTATVKTLAHWIPVTNRMLNDAPAIRGVIDSRLLMGLDLTLEAQIIEGNGSGENLTGITATSGVLTQVATSGALIDDIFRMMIKVEISGLLMPNATVVHPLQYQTIRLARENAATGTQGAYLMGPPNMIGTPTLWGNPLVQALGVSSGTVVVGDWSSQGVNLFDAEEAVVRAGYINDYFIRNMQVILAELRAALVVWRPKAFAVLTGAS
jgi:HK97 family phage major capsid protein